MERRESCLPDEGQAHPASSATPWVADRSEARSPHIRIPRNESPLALEELEDGPEQQPSVNNPNPGVLSAELKIPIATSSDPKGKGKQPVVLQDDSFASPPIWVTTDRKRSVSFADEGPEAGNGPTSSSTHMAMMMRARSNSRTSQILPPDGIDFFAAITINAEEEIYRAQIGEEEVLDWRFFRKYFELQLQTYMTQEFVAFQEEEASSALFAKLNPEKMTLMALVRRRQAAARTIQAFYRPIYRKLHPLSGLRLAQAPCSVELNESENRALLDNEEALLRKRIGMDCRAIYLKQKFFVKVKAQMSREEPLVQLTITEREKRWEIMDAQTLDFKAFQTVLAPFQIEAQHFSKRSLIIQDELARRPQFAIPNTTNRSRSSSSASKTPNSAPESDPEVPAPMATTATYVPSAYAKRWIAPTVPTTIEDLQIQVEAIRNNIQMEESSQFGLVLKLEAQEMKKMTTARQVLARLERLRRLPGRASPLQRSVETSLANMNAALRAASVTAAAFPPPPCKDSGRAGDDVPWLLDDTAAVAGAVPPLGLGDKVSKLRQSIQDGRMLFGPESEKLKDLCLEEKRMSVVSTVNTGAAAQGVRSMSISSAAQPHVFAL